MSFSLFVTLRYLHSRTNLSTTRWISLISAVAIGVVTAALVCVLAVYNGYATLVLSGEKDSSPEYLLTNSKANFFDGEKVIQTLKDNPHIKHISNILQSQGVLQSSELNFVVEVYGIDSNYMKSVAMGRQIEEGTFINFKPIEEVPDVLLGLSLANEGAVKHTDSLNTKLIFPKREGFINPLAPASAFTEQVVNVSGVLMAYSGDVNRRVYMDIKVLQSLLNHRSTMVSSIAITPQKGSQKADIEKSLIHELKDQGFLLLDREEQHPELTLLIKTEKVMVYFIMLFVLILAAFNLSSSLVMLIIEKRENIKTLIALGANNQHLTQIFISTGILTSAIGSGTGLIFGLGLCYLQKQFNFLSSGDGINNIPFPIEMQWLDILYIILATLAISAISALLPSIFIKKQIGVTK